MISYVCGLFNKPSVPIALFGLVGILTWAIPASADSDGYFCIGPDYLAYELWIDGAPQLGHRFYLMRFDDPQGWKEPSTVDFPETLDGNLGPLRCEESSVFLFNWNANYRVSWEAVRLDNLTLHTLPKTPGPEGQEDYPDTLGSLSLGVTKNVGQYSVVLPTRDTAQSYELNIVITPDPANRCVRKIRSFVSQMSADSVLDEHELYAGDIHVACGE